MNKMNEKSPLIFKLPKEVMYYIFKFLEEEKDFLPCLISCRWFREMVEEFFYDSLTLTDRRVSISTFVFKFGNMMKKPLPKYINSTFCDKKYVTSLSINPRTCNYAKKTSKIEIVKEKDINEAISHFKKIFSEDLGEYFEFLGPDFFKRKRKKSEEINKISDCLKFLEERFQFSIRFSYHNDHPLHLKTYLSTFCQSFKVYGYVYTVYSNRIRVVDSFFDFRCSIMKWVNTISQKDFKYEKKYFINFGLDGIFGNIRGFFPKFWSDLRKVSENSVKLIDFNEQNNIFVCRRFIITRKDGYKAGGKISKTCISDFLTDEKVNAFGKNYKTIEKYPSSSDRVRNLMEITHNRQINGLTGHVIRHVKKIEEQGKKIEEQGKKIEEQGKINEEQGKINEEINLQLKKLFEELGKKK